MMREAFLRSDAPPSDKLGGEVTSCLSFIHFHTLILLPSSGRASAGTTEVATRGSLVSLSLRVSVSSLNLFFLHPVCLRLLDSLSFNASLSYFIPSSLI